VPKLTFIEAHTETASGWWGSVSIDGRSYAYVKAHEKFYVTDKDVLHCIEVTAITSDTLTYIDRVEGKEIEEGLLMPGQTVTLELEHV